MEPSMNADRASMEAVLERLEKLERPNRRLRLGGLAVLEATPGGPNLSLYSADGARRLNIGVLAQGPVLGLLAPNGAAKAAFGITGDNAFVHLFGTREHGGAQLFATPDRTVLRFFDSNDRPRAVLGMLETENAPG